MKRFQYVLMLALAMFIFGCTTAMTKDMRLSDQGLEAINNRNYTEAENHLNDALAINHDNPYAILNMGVVYQNTNRPAKAKEMYEKVIKMNPQAEATKSNIDEQRGRSLVNIAKDNLKLLQ